VGEGPAFTAAFKDYYRRELGFEIGDEYAALPPTMERRRRIAIPIPVAFRQNEVNDVVRSKSSVRTLVSCHGASTETRTVSALPLPA